MILAALLSAFLPRLLAAPVTAAERAAAAATAPVPAALTGLATILDKGDRPSHEILCLVCQLAGYPEDHSQNESGESVVAAVAADPTLVERHRPELEAVLGPERVARLHALGVRINHDHGLTFGSDLWDRVVPVLGKGRQTLSSLRALYDGGWGAGAIAARPAPEAAGFIPAETWPGETAQGEAQRVHLLGHSGQGWLINGKRAESLWARQDADGPAEELLVHPDHPDVLVRLYHSPTSLAGFESKSEAVESLAALSLAQVAPRLLEHGEAVVPGKGRVYFFAQERAKGRPLSEFAAGFWPSQALDDFFSRLTASGLKLLLPASGRDWLMSHLFVDEADGRLRVLILKGMVVADMAKPLAAYYAMLRSLLTPDEKAEATSVSAPAPRPLAAEHAPEGEPERAAASLPSGQAKIQLLKLLSHPREGDVRSLWVHLGRDRHRAEASAILRGRELASRHNLVMRGLSTSPNHGFYLHFQADDEISAARAALALDGQDDIELIEVPPGLLHRLRTQPPAEAGAPAASAADGDKTAPAEDPLALAAAINDGNKSEDEAYGASKRLELLLSERPAAASAELEAALREQLAAHVRSISEFQEQDGSVPIEEKPPLRVAEAFARYGQLAETRPELVSPELKPLIQTLFAAKARDKRGYYYLDQRLVTSRSAAALALAKLARAGDRRQPDLFSLADAAGILRQIEERRNEYGGIFGAAAEGTLSWDRVEDEFAAILVRKSLSSWPAVVLDLKVADRVLVQSLDERRSVSDLADFTLEDLARAFARLQSFASNRYNGKAMIAKAQAAAEIYKDVFVARARKGGVKEAFDLLARWNADQRRWENPNVEYGRLSLAMQKGSAEYRALMDAR